MPTCCRGPSREVFLSFSQRNLSREVVRKTSGIKSLVSHFHADSDPQVLIGGYFNNHAN